MKIGAESGGPKVFFSYPILFYGAYEIAKDWAWMVALGLIACISFFVWATNLKRNRAIADLPTSKVASAAQGYVELYGVASADPDYRTKGIRSLPCVWYQQITYQKRNEDWVEIERQTSASLFALDDGTGVCLIDPADAEVLTTHSYTREEFGYKIEELLLKPNDDLYALGNFTTVRTSHSSLDVEAEISDLLESWRKDQPMLLRRFDHDKDGKISSKEWEKARAEARHEVESQCQQIRQQGGVNVMRVPTDGRLFLLSNLSPEQLRTRYQFWGWIHLIVFSISFGCALWLSRYLWRF